MLSLGGVFAPIISANLLASVSDFNYQMAMWLVVWYGVINSLSPMIAYVNSYVYIKVAYKVEQDIRYDLISAITSFTVKKYDPMAGKWSSVNFTFEKAPQDKQTIDGYTVWVVPEEYEILADGDIYRFVIEGGI